MTHDEAAFTASVEAEDSVDGNDDMNGNGPATRSQQGPSRHEAHELSDLLSRIEAADPAEATTLVQLLARTPALQYARGAPALRAARALSVHGGPQAFAQAGELAARAHRDGVAGAGVVFAECADKMSLLSGRPQQFGTVVTSHLGDLVLAPMDGSVDDAARARLGLPSVAQRQSEIDKRNRELARERADQDGLPAGQRMCRIWRDPSEAWLAEHLGAQASCGWANGDELTLACRSDAAGLLPGPVIELPMWRVGGGDLWALSVRIERLPEAVIGYGFWPLDAGGGLLDGRRGAVPHRFRGPAAPEELPSHRDHELRGTSAKHTLDSTALRTKRNVTVYLPPRHSPAEQLPVLYATDGNMIGPYIRRIDAGISRETVPRCVVVAAHAAPMAGYGNDRAMEYLPGFDDDRFDRHQRFFVDELAVWAEQQFNVSDERSRRAVFGASDGGGHALAVGHMHRDKFGHAMAYSTGMPPNERMNWNATEAPFVHLCAGTLEGGFHQATEAWAAWLHFAKSPHHWVERVCGHDLIQWVEELPRAITRAWG
ncbi:alpha/beta hydrolase [Candidatus Poriferisodalis sp.]|uniref:alpha/beta hydrolase n=1 Tax=Candidatus Poriferisodalis sp. TaxID=3101277 RepID=UPI003B02AAD9